MTIEQLCRNIYIELNSNKTTFEVDTNILLMLKKWHNEQIEKAAQIGEKYDVVSRCVMEIRSLKL